MTPLNGGLLKKAVSKENMLNLVNAFLLYNNWPDYVGFVLHFDSVVYYTDWFSYVKSFLYSKI